MDIQRLDFRFWDSPSECLERGKRCHLVFHHLLHLM
jgi:hypothetical protein